MDRVFLDANVLFSAAYRKDSGLKRLWEIAASGALELLSSHYAVEEARRNLNAPAARGRLQRLLTQVQLGTASSSPPKLPRTLSLPVKDRPILQAAIEMHATHLLTGDVTHFGKLYGRVVQGVFIATPGEYSRRTSKVV